MPNSQAMHFFLDTLGCRPRLILASWSNCELFSFWKITKSTLKKTSYSLSKTLKNPCFHHFSIFNITASGSRRILWTLDSLSNQIWRSLVLPLDVNGSMDGCYELLSVSFTQKRPAAQGTIKQSFLQLFVPNNWNLAKVEIQWLGCKFPTSFGICWAQWAAVSGSMSALFPFHSD